MKEDTEDCEPPNNYWNHGRRPHRGRDSERSEASWSCGNSGRAHTVDRRMRCREHKSEGCCDDRPDGPRCWNERGHCLLLSTNLNHMERDAINGVTPDVLIFFAGSSGTLCEFAFALQAQKPILFWRARETQRRRQAAHVAYADMAVVL